MAVGQLDWVQQQVRINSNSSASSSTSHTDSSTSSCSSSRSSSSSSSRNGHSGDGERDGSMGRGMSGQSVVYVGLEGEGVVGALGFSDILRPDSQYVVQQLHNRGIRVVVLSGDR